MLRCRDIGALDLLNVSVKHLDSFRRDCICCKESGAMIVLQKEQVCGIVDVDAHIRGNIACLTLAETLNLGRVLERCVFGPDFRSSIGRERTKSRSVFPRSTKVVALHNGKGEA